MDRRDPQKPGTRMVKKLERPSTTQHLVGWSWECAGISDDPGWRKPVRVRMAGAEPDAWICGEDVSRHIALPQIRKQAKDRG